MKIWHNSKTKAALHKHAVFELLYNSVNIVLSEHSKPVIHYMTGTAPEFNQVKVKYLLTAVSKHSQYQTDRQTCLFSQKQ